MVNDETPTTGLAVPTATTIRVKQLTLVVETLGAAPETINSATQLYYELYLEYTFGSLDMGKLLLQKDQLTQTLQDGKDAQETAKTMLKSLRDLPSRSSHYVPL